MNYPSPSAGSDSGDSASEDSAASAAPATLNRKDRSLQESKMTSRPASSCGGGGGGMGGPRSSPVAKKHAKLHLAGVAGAKRLSPAEDLLLA